ncbi:low-density lipoprotein receptor-related protein 12-like [Asterias amurensis]|uniref:low-density lipoprotein receptor-related protein 12-like n=1 Tax=Asterias amurensis TaxID=7602 RepID=UPI003AB5B1C3
MEMFCSSRCGFVFLVTLMVFCQAKFVNGIDYLDEHCGRTIDIDEALGGVLYSQSDPLYSSNLDCDVALETSSFVKKILLTFNTVDIDGSAPCSSAGDVLEIYNGLSTDERDKLLTVCGSSNTPSEVTSTLNHITLRFKTDNETVESGFRIAYTAFSSGTCRSSEFECDNGRCIDQDLTYNSYDNCGDSSDESVDDILTGILQWGIAVFIIILVVIVVGAVLLCVCIGCLSYHCCCKSRKQPQTIVLI